MSCWRKRRKRTVEQERVYQEQARKVAQENGKRLGESPPPHPTQPRRCFHPHLPITWVRVLVVYLLVFCVADLELLRRRAAGKVNKASCAAQRSFFLPGAVDSHHLCKGDRQCEGVR